MKDLMLNTDKDADDTSMVISDEGIASDRTSLVSSRRSSIESFKDKGPGKCGLLTLSVLEPNFEDLCKQFGSR
ncbi:hypothetical protein DPMN_119650 [Dreissena polymorpha]|uniref:Uncharacterized protein n=1 Tax=Dreissena polymorpha TaxID=45954 RepID=A0A9D4JMW0_DREPO|nr:hypothetical protein DPMN_119650 [Dreissena polymorpha]